MCGLCKVVERIVMNGATPSSLVKSSPDQLFAQVLHIALACSKQVHRKYNWYRKKKKK